MFSGAFGGDAVSLLSFSQILSASQSVLINQSSLSLLSGKASSISEDSGVIDGHVALNRKTSGKQPDAVKVNEPSRKTSIQTNGTEMSAVLQQLVQLITSNEWVDFDQNDNQNVKSVRDYGQRPKLSELGRIIVTAASLKAYIGLLGTHHKQSIAAWLYGNTSQALCKLFSFPTGELRCLESGYSPIQSIKSGIGIAIRLALRDVYGPEYATRGWRAFAETGAPVIYLSPALGLQMASYIASEFVISDVITLPKLKGEHASLEGRIDYNAFEMQLDKDLSDGKKPLLVVGVVGSTLLSQNDTISRLLELRKNKSRFWLHVVGQGTAALLTKEPSEVMIQVLSQVDSMLVPLAQWLGIPAAPAVMLHRPIEAGKLSFKDKLDVLPWWIATQYLTSKAITDIVDNAYYLSKMMLKGLSTFPQIQIIGIDNPVDFANKVYKGRCMPPTVIVFKYRHLSVHKDDEVITSKQSSKDTKQEAEKSLSLPPDFNSETSQNKQDDFDEFVESLNAWMCNGLLPSCKQLGLQVVELGGKYGVAFRFCTLETAAILSTMVNHVQDFMKELSNILKILESTAAARKRFIKIAESCSSLKVMKTQKWAGVGVVCFVPSTVKEVNSSEWTAREQDEISQLNMELVHSLRTVDSGFSLGERTKYGVSCVKFGMLADEKDLDHLLDLVSKRGREIEQSQQYMDSLAKMIKQGIQAANEDLKKENDARLMQEGVVRQIPLMGSLFNWLSPLDKSAQTVKGRSFDLKTGQIQSTEVFYKSRSKSTEPTSEEEKKDSTSKAEAGPPDLEKSGIVSESVGEQVIEKS